MTKPKPADNFMLKRLQIFNLALIDKVTLEFGEGLNVITGETGAGKSVVVTALALLLGMRADRDLVRHGTSQARVEATFENRAGDRLTIQRTVSANGQSRAMVNDNAATVAALRELTSPLAEIMGQHSGQRLMDEQNHLLFLDQFGKLDQLREKVSSLFGDWQQSEAKLRKIRQRRRQLIERRELLLFQRDEIEKAGLSDGEEAKLIAEKRVLDSARTLMASASLITGLIDSESNSVMELLRTARTEIDKSAAIDSSLETQASDLRDIEVRLEEFRRDIEQYGSTLSDDPARLEEINVRLDEIYRMRQKYGGSEAAVLEHLEEIRSEVLSSPNVDALIAELEDKSARLRTEYAADACDLSRKRRLAATRLDKLVVKELGQLAIDEASFAVELVRQDTNDGIDLDGRMVVPTEVGLESGRILFSANPGEPLRSLIKTASGGEISRVLLALKAAEQSRPNQARTVLVFDEVDAGIGGRTAGAVAKKLGDLAQGRQLIVVTHLHQIARVASQHFGVDKTAGRDSRKLILIKRLEKTERLAEINRMIDLPDELAPAKS